MPKEIWHLVDKLYRHGIKTPGLFETPGLHSEIVAIRDWLDECSQDSIRILLMSENVIFLDTCCILLFLNYFLIFVLRVAGSIHSIAEALLLLLESTAEPLIPYNLHNVCLSAATNYLQCKQASEIKTDFYRITPDIFIFQSFNLRTKMTKCIMLFVCR